jgi:hypothetical protein
LPEYRGRAYEVAWSQADRGPNELTLSGAGPGGLRFTRRIWIQGGEAAVYTATQVTNNGTGPMRVALQARAEYSPRDDLDGAGLALRYRGQDGVAFDSALFQPGQETAGNRTLTGALRPAGSWQAYHLSGVPGLASLFRPQQVERCTMDWSLRGASTITLAQWTREAELKPGETLALDAAYGVVQAVGQVPDLPAYGSPACRDSTGSARSPA